jgi:hypothetical protein
MFRYRRVVEPFDKYVSEAISEAMETVVTPAAEWLEGKKLSFDELQEHGLREQRLTTSWPQSAEFFWKHKTVALLVVSMEGKNVCIEAESGDTFE